MKVAVIGASGFVGTRLVPALQAAGHEVTALTRRPRDYAATRPHAGTPRYADLDDPDSLISALTGTAVVYLLAHSLGSAGFAQREAKQGRALALAATETGLSQIVFLGGLGRDDDELSEHLRSRRNVERVLAQGTTPVTVLRAAILIGSGSAGWEILRQSLSSLPLLVADRRAHTRHQPIAVEDAVGYLVDVLGRADCQGRTFEIGGPDVLTYREMAESVATLTGRWRPVLEAPWLPDVVAAAAVALVTDVDGSTARDLFGSMGNEAIVTNHDVGHVLPRQTLTFAEAARRALAESAGKGQGALGR